MVTSKLEKLPELHCFRCVYTWTPRRIPVRMCPRCKSRLWDRPKLSTPTAKTGNELIAIVKQHRLAIIALAQKYGAKQVRVFGSVSRGMSNDRSDVDLLVDDLPGASLLDLARLEVELTRLLGRTVDVVEEDSLPWSMRAQVLADAVPL